MHIAHQFLAFVTVGGISTAGHYTLFIGLAYTANVEPTLASTIGFIGGAIINYILNYRFTFKATGTHTTIAPRFIAAALSGMLLNAGLLATGVYILKINYLAAQIASTAVVLFWNFIINKYWTFSGQTPCPTTPQKNQTKT
ncbi:GtrA family protein [Ectothiorhodospira lacustris]|uniref:GtrA family protein n=1 Tax=Ectothiorhodospira lacustris TaxID=2899127 RepID=UPI001EE9466E|nr:GtrA family protein [Ectothiorhodospira lacustris]MCG5510354.1 GtrA family protein [Ectothiorhodospira lacustris]MCG5522100.1 GtrA family protein [Ectothiorhodospira lacustris]